MLLMLILFCCRCCHRCCCCPCCCCCCFCRCCRCCCCYIVVDVTVAVMNSTQITAYVAAKARGHDPVNVLTSDQQLLSFFVGVVVVLVVSTNSNSGNNSSSNSNNSNNSKSCYVKSKGNQKQSWRSFMRLQMSRFAMVLHNKSHHIEIWRCLKVVSINS